MRLSQQEPFPGGPAYPVSQWEPVADLLFPQEPPPASGSVPRGPPPPLPIRGMLLNHPKDPLSQSDSIVSRPGDVLGQWELILKALCPMGVHRWPPGSDSSPMGVDLEGPLASGSLSLASQETFLANGC